MSVETAQLKLAIRVLRDTLENVRFLRHVPNSKMTLTLAEKVAQLQEDTRFDMLCKVSELEAMLDVIIDCDDEIQNILVGPHND